MNPKPGDQVYYAGRVLYYEPNGKCCYLYTKHEYVGRPECAVFAPSISSIKYPIPMNVKLTSNYDLQSLSRFPSSIQEEIRNCNDRVSSVQHEIEQAIAEIDADIDWLDGLIDGLDDHKLPEDRL